LQAGLCRANTPRFGGINFEKIAGQTLNGFQYLFVCCKDGVTGFMASDSPDKILIVYGGAGCISLVIPFHDSTRRLKRCGQGC